MNAPTSGLEEWRPLIRGAPFPCQRALPEIYNRPQNFTTGRMGRNRIVTWDFAPRCRGVLRKGVGKTQQERFYRRLFLFIAMFAVRRSKKVFCSILKKLWKRYRRRVFFLVGCRFIMVFIAYYDGAEK
ncbi:hypothetical protein CDAR_544541 [Caerostris darwini]|uniref:Uncharacterized protein n=1 Tax=Caerostris darwini TaxID=1538125 RepID=A0AAV4QF90_9ARAC|nr:hypothetical protein CDAR_544541 [Caerostris darwini]